MLGPWGPGSGLAVGHDRGGHSVVTCSVLLCWQMSGNSSKRAPTTATQRLKQDYLRIKKDPVPYVCAEPLPSNILEW